MKVEKPPQLNKNLASTLPSVRLLGTLFGILFVLGFPVLATENKEITTPKTFTDWCLNKNNLSVETRHTVDVLLQEAETSDCHQAEKLLSTLTHLSPMGGQITDLKPLSTLTNLTSLQLAYNSITDLKPLSTLTNLAALGLAHNSITDLKPLSTLTNLAVLRLDNNSTCPVQLESICSFVQDD